MEVYAGMIDCIDQNIGHVLSFLEGSGELDGESFPETVVVVIDQRDRHFYFIHER